MQTVKPAQQALPKSLIAPCGVGMGHLHCLITGDELHLGIPDRP